MTETTFQVYSAVLTKGQRFCSQVGLGANLGDFGHLTILLNLDFLIYKNTIPGREMTQTLCAHVTKRYKKTKRQYLLSHRVAVGIKCNVK
jgi:hypothetical protein